MEKVKNRMKKANRTEPVVSRETLAAIQQFAGRAVLAGFILLLPVFGLSGCAEQVAESPGAEERDPTISNGEEESTMENQLDWSMPEKPPIDMEVPERLETATLALG